ncbi:hypothetical protein ACA30_07635 [Virgibacillus soli]|nr:hypothetical protein ACA30_07635 [Virgibacillus soli]
MNVDILIHKIVSKVEVYRQIEAPEVPWFPTELYQQKDGEGRIIAPLFEKEFKKDYQALREALRIIVEENIIIGLKVTDYPDSDRIVGLDVTDVIMSDYALELAATSPLKVKMKAAVSTLFDKFNEHQEKVNKRIEYYDRYSDEELIRMVKRNSFSTTVDRIAVASILKERGYAKE